MSQFIVTPTTFLISFILGYFRLPCWEEKAGVHLPQRYFPLFVLYASYLHMTDNGTSWAILMRVAIALLADQVTAGVDMPQMKQILSCYGFSSCLCRTILFTFIAQHLPIVALVAKSIVSIPRHFLSVTDGTLHAEMGVQVLACRVVL